MGRHARPATVPRSSAALQWGRVISAHGRHVMVVDQAGERHLCHPRGKKNECVVGDEVDWAISGDEGVIEGVRPRRNLLFRQDEWRTKSFAANLDALLILVAAEPSFSESQLTRALVAAEHAGIPAWIGLNKVDLPSASLARERLLPYQAMGIEVMALSLTSQPQEAHAHLLARLAGQSTLVLGPSGMGKSTLINLMVPQAKATTGEISQALQSGRHTTTSTTWYELEGGGALIDSPGFQEFGLAQVDAMELARFMPDLRTHLGECRFYNCTHRHEPGCALRAQFEAGKIHPNRWRIYGELFDELSRPSHPG